jgi:hypothetical protein
MGSCQHVAASSALALSLACIDAGAQELPFFQRVNGAFYHYVAESQTRYEDLREKIESGYYESRGIQYLVIYCPYQSSGDWRGVPAINFFSTNATNGTIEDFAAMTAAAHERGMGIVAYMGLLFVDRENEIWQKAQEDKANGLSSTEAGIFRWADEWSDEGLPSQGGWEFSDEADSYYATSWGYPALDIEGESGRAYIKSILEFWIDQGVDGFEYDAPQSFWGQSTERLTTLLADEPRDHYGSPLYLIVEGGWASYENEEENDTIGMTHILLNGDNDQGSFATAVIDGDLSVDELEQHFAAYVDPRRLAGRGVKSVSTYRELPAEERALEAAVLAGNGSLMEIDYEEVYSQLDAGSAAAYDSVFRALSRSPAEAPVADRERLSTGDDPNHYAVLRTSRGGDVSALNVYNFGEAATTVVVDLSGSDIEPGSTPTDLVSNAAAPPVTSESYSVDLPAHGFAFLQFGEQPASASGGASSGAGGSTSSDAGGGKLESGTGGQAVGGGSEPASGSAAAAGGDDKADDAPQGNSQGCGCAYVPPSMMGAWVGLFGLAFGYGRRRQSARRGTAPNSSSS